MSKQLALKEVLNLNFFNYSTGKPMFRLDYCEDTSIMTEAERLDLRGGQGNYKLVSFDHTKNSTMKLSAPIVDLELIAYLSGKELNVGAVQVPHDRQVLTTNASNQITLEATPVSGTLYIYALEGDRDLGTEQTLGTPASNQNEYSISGAVVTLNATSGAQGNKFAVYYDYTAPATTLTTTITADKFADYVRVTGFGIATDLVTGSATVPVAFEVLKAKAKNTINLTLKSTEATKIELDLDLYSVDVTNESGGTDKIYFKMYELI